MDILLWLVPAAVATAIAAVLAGRAAGREEEERLRRLAVRLEAEAARDADRLAVDDVEGVSTPRPITAPPTPDLVDPADLSPAERPAPDEERRSA